MRLSCKSLSLDGVVLFLLEIFWHTAMTILIMMSYGGIIEDDLPELIKSLEQHLKG